MRGVPNNVLSAIQSHGHLFFYAMKDTDSIFPIYTEVYSDVEVFYLARIVEHQDASQESITSFDFMAICPNRVGKSDDCIRNSGDSLLAHFVAFSRYSLDDMLEESVLTEVTLLQSVVNNRDPFDSEQAVQNFLNNRRNTVPYSHLNGIVTFDSTDLRRILIPVDSESVDAGIGAKTMNGILTNPEDLITSKESKTCLNTVDELFMYFSNIGELLEVLRNDPQDVKLISLDCTKWQDTSSEFVKAFLFKDLEKVNFGLYNTESSRQYKLRCVYVQRSGDRHEVYLNTEKVLNLKVTLPEELGVSITPAQLHLPGKGFVSAQRIMTMKDITTLRVIYELDGHDIPAPAIQPHVRPAMLALNASARLESSSRLFR